MSDTTTKALIRVLIVEDSATARELLVYILNSDPAIEVVGVAKTGEEGLAAAQRLRPDIITMDNHLPDMNGFVATRKIMETCPTRIIMVTASSVPNKVADMFQTLEAGALTVLARPLGIQHPDYPKDAQMLLDTVKLMSEIKVVKRWSQARTPHTLPRKVVPLISHGTEVNNREVRIVAMGASTGGPLVLQTILSGLPKNFPIPILIVQHISHGFAGGFAEWLSTTAKYPVRVAVHGEIMQPGIAYLAPDDKQMKVIKNNFIALADEESEYNLRPSVSYLFRSIAEEYGANAVGVLLTGMGRDGAKELLLLRTTGAITIAQSQESCVIYGMPGEAEKLNAAIHWLDPGDIAIMLNRLVKEYPVADFQYRGNIP